MIKCSECGFDNPELNKFCQNCGAAIAIKIEEIGIDNTDIESNGAIDLVSNPNKADSTEEIATIDTSDTSEIPSSENLMTELPKNLTVTPEVAETALIQPPQADVTAPELLPPASLVKLRYAGLSDVGRERDHNEDGFRCFSQFMTTISHSQPEFITQRGLFILCDGMGGHEGGEVASALALESIAQSFKSFWTSGLPSQEEIKGVIAIANQAIYERNELELRRNAGRMGTTLVILMIFGAEVAIAHIGDSRIYKVTTDGLTQLTRDHEVAVKLIDQGVPEAIAYSRPDAHQLTQALGPNPSLSLEPSIQFLSLESSSLFLLCSDGLSDNEVVESHLQELSPLLALDSDLKVGAEHLVQIGNDLNGYDNISAVLVHCQIKH